ncbi:glycoside hydrolase family 95 protein [Paenibacillus oryzisoli]|uniref:glycoside hydrolase family 95 protein n=1 Tax=Paenibacillus oryzisoli TaxID=1850517 RepID=UPI003D278B68
MKNRSKLWYRQPAAIWTEALPIGNGRLGAMVFGQVEEERIQLNEDSIWYGGPKEGLNPDAPRFFGEIRSLLFAGKVEEATRLTRLAMFSTPKYYNPYLPLGDLRFYFHRHMASEAQDYHRELDLDQAVASTSYTVNGVKFRRELFSSYPDQVMVIRLTCDPPGQLHFSANLNRRPYEGLSGAWGNDGIWMSGECGKDGVAYACAVRAVAEDGQVSVVGDFLSVEGATKVTLLLTAGSTFRSKDPLASCKAQICSAEAYSYDDLKERHVRDYRELYGRMELKLADSTAENELAALPTDRRLERLKESQGHDLGLTELLFNYGRYLLIASSRPGSLPANLQGIWNDSFTPPWESKYTININTQMNYWPAEVCGLSECHEPLFDHIGRMQESGRQTARELYGCSGFVAHHNTNIWGETRPEGLFPTCVIWPMGAAWLVLHLWDRFRFEQDQKFLRDRAYPLLKDAALFFIEYLVESPSGYMVSGPSVSPENRYVLEDGTSGSLCMGPSMDTQILTELFDACIQSSELLQLDEAFRAQLVQLRAQLPPQRIGKHGQIMEWLEDYEEEDKGHRHISQLFALHPGTQISPHRTPELAQAAAVTLARRIENGGGHTGWSSAWILNMYARLEEGDHALAYVNTMLRKSMYPNLFDAHPPFQIDGNFGFTAGIVEMLLHSHDDELSLLPALPSAWADGDVVGLRGRGGYRIALSWRQGKLTRAVLHATSSGVCRVRTKSLITLQAAVEATARPLEEVSHESSDSHVLSFPVSAGRSYELTAHS